MLLYLEAIHVNYVLFDDCVLADMAEPARFVSALIYEKDNRICCGHILHYLLIFYLIFIALISLQKKNLGSFEKGNIQLKMLGLRNMW